MIRFALTSDVHAGFSQKTHIKHDKLIANLQDEDWDVLIIAGDIATNSPRQMESFFKRLRTKIDYPIICVRGNHDFWDYEKAASMEAILDNHEQMFKDYGIYHLEKGPYVLDGVSVFGWDGWYASSYALDRTNDAIMMPGYTNFKPSYVWQMDRCHKEFSRCLEELESAPPNIKKVVVSHMPILEIPNMRSELNGSERYWELIKDKIDVFCYGHVHLAYEDIVDGVKIYSAPVDYDKPGFTTFSV